MEQVMKNGYTVSFDVNGRASFKAVGLWMPDMQWSFYHRPTTHLGELKPLFAERSKASDTIGDYDEFVFEYQIKEGLKAKTHFIAYDEAMASYLEVENTSQDTVWIMLLSLSCDKPDLNAIKGRPVLRTCSSGARPLNAGIPSEVQISPLMPQVGAIYAESSSPCLLLANLDGYETFNIQVDSPFDGSLSFGFPIEDEFSCGRRAILPGTKYKSDRLFLQFSTSSSDPLAELRRCFAALHPPRRGPIAARIKSWWNSWYAYKSSINEEIIKKSIDYAAETHLDAVELDEGWMLPEDKAPAEAESATWLIDETKFPSGLQGLTEYAGKHNVKVMLWCRPYMVKASDKLLQERPEAFLRRADGSLIHWVNGYLLDPLHPFTGPYLKRNFEKLNAQGIAGYKVDFLGPLVSLQNEHFKDGLMSPGKWARILWSQLSDAIGADRLIHCSTPMCPSPALWPYYNVVRIWGDNEPYFHRGLYGYAALPFLLALTKGLPVRMESDMALPTAFWDLLCENNYRNDAFLDALGCAFVGGAFYITEHLETFDPERRELVKMLVENYKRRDFKADSLFGRVAWTFHDSSSYMAFARRRCEVAIPVGQWVGKKVTSEGRIENISLGKYDTKYSLETDEFLFIRKG